MLLLIIRIILKVIRVNFLRNSVQKVKYIIIKTIILSQFVILILALRNTQFLFIKTDQFVIFRLNILFLSFLFFNFLLSLFQRLLCCFWKLFHFFYNMLYIIFILFCNNWRLFYRMIYSVIRS